MPTAAMPPRVYQPAGGHLQQGILGHQRRLVENAFAAGLGGEDLRHHEAEEHPHEVNDQPGLPAKPPEHGPHKQGREQHPYHAGQDDAPVGQEAELGLQRVIREGGAADDQLQPVEAQDQQVAQYQVDEDPPAVAQDEPPPGAVHGQGQGEGSGVADAVKEHRGHQQHDQSDHRAHAEPGAGVILCDHNQKEQKLAEDEACRDQQQIPHKGAGQAACAWTVAKHSNPS